MGLLVLISSILALALLATVLSGDGLGVLDGVMLFCFALTLPWTMIGFWNALIGFCILYFAKDPISLTCPPINAAKAHHPIRGKTAIVMAVHEEDPGRVFSHMQTLAADLEVAPFADKFEFFVLSDTQDVGIAAKEAKLYSNWLEHAQDSSRIHYRRRFDNQDHKTGNIWEFLDSRGADFDYFIMLDADSLMSGELVHKLVRTMDATPDLGICQPLIAGLPNDSAFVRVFQLGMRHGMRAYATGGAWWQGDAGPFWGHNAILRTAPFLEHCRLPKLPGEPPHGGLILSHDQVEAALMRGAGYKVYVLPDEQGSYEENPPTLQDFIKRDLRWCQGNMQYWRLLGLKGLLPMGRLQLILAILMYVAAPAWLAFMFVGLAQAAILGLFHSTSLQSMDGLQAGAYLEASYTSLNYGLGIGLFAIMMTINFTPKIAGLLSVLFSAKRRAIYGGAGPVMVSGLLETVFSLFLGPIMAVSQTIFIIGLISGRTISWEAQRRSAVALSWGEAFSGLWPQTLIGFGMLALLWAFAPAVLPWALPIVLALVLAVPFAWLTSQHAFGGLLKRHRICSTPEELTMMTPIAKTAFGSQAKEIGNVTSNQAA